MSDDTRFDGILMSVIQQKGNIDGFFDSIFGFLRRNTDFFANQKKAEQIIVNNCKTNFEKYNSDQIQKKKEEQQKKQAEEKKKKLKEQKLKQQQQQQQQQKVQEKPKTVIKEEKVVEGEKKEEGEEDNTPAPIGNGGRTQSYIWTQTLENLEMFIYLDSSVTKKQIKVNINLDSLKVEIGGVAIIDGKLFDKINAEDSIWTIEDGEVQDYRGKYIHINIEKWKNQTSWWKTPIKGHVEINTQKINPESSKLSDLDGETRTTVEKMMFDMRQKQQGKPSSDELLKQEKLKEFMKSHPEMDFSQCKFN